MDKDYNKAIKEAEEKLIDVKKRGQDALGDDALEFMDSLMSQDERDKSDLRVETIEKKIKRVANNYFSFATLFAASLYTFESSLMPIMITKTSSLCFSNL